MTAVRMSLTEAAAALNVAVNSVRSRYKAGKLRGERDNSGKIWVWVDPAEQGSKRHRSKPSIEPSSKPSIEGELRALQDHVETLKADLIAAHAERDSLRARARLADQLEAHIEGLKTTRDHMQEAMGRLRGDCDKWQAQAEQALRSLTTAPAATPEPKRAWWKRLAG